MKSFLRKPLLIAALAMSVAASTLTPALAYHEGPFTDVHPSAHQTFWETHRRTDQPIISGVKRTWIWGPEAYAPGMLEPYEDAPGGMRLVQYFDKSRMEINNPSGNQSDHWYVTNGLLVVDMIEGRYQIGDAKFDHSPEPAQMAIAGDQDETSDVTYAAIASSGLRSKPALAIGSTITQTFKNGSVGQDSKYTAESVNAAHHVQKNGIDHTVASVFWEFMNSEGYVYNEWNLVNEKLFKNPFYATGYPITEAYWSTVNIKGFPQDVLWQCFERRCLTYTPFNSPEWKVEAGNVGQHYFRWRYGDAGPSMVPANVGMVALNDGGVQGPLFGCHDSLVNVSGEIQNLAAVEHRVQAAIQTLLVTNPGTLYNVFHEKNLIVEKVLINGNTATIYLIGDLGLAGVCDEPRVEEQLRATATQFAGVDNVKIMVNGVEF